MTSGTAARDDGGQGVTFVLGGDLPALLHHRYRAQCEDGVLRYPLGRRTSVKDALEATGPPHTEVESIIVDGRAVDFGHLLQDGQRVDVLAPEPPVDFLETTLLKPWAPGRPAFLADVNVGGLATQLRVLGFDTEYDNTLDDAEAASIADAEQRIVLTRDRALLKRSNVVWGRLLRAQEPEEQLAEVLAFFGLRPPYATFTRCVRCNDLLQDVAKADVLHLLEPKTRKYYDAFKMCPSCGRVYWAGSHHERLRERVERLSRRIEKGAKKDFANS